MVLDLIRTWLGLGLGGFGTKGLGTGLDNFSCEVAVCLRSNLPVWSLTLITYADDSLQRTAGDGLLVTAGSPLDISLRLSQAISKTDCPCDRD